MTTPPVDPEVLSLTPEREEKGAFVAPHGMAIDGNGDLYLGEVSGTYCRMDELPTEGLHSLLKLVRL